MYNSSIIRIPSLDFLHEAMHEMQLRNVKIIGLIPNIELERISFQINIKSLLGDELMYYSLFVEFESYS